MAIQLSEYQDLLDELGEHASDVLEATWHEAARVFSPRGLQAYLEGASALKSLGRGTDLVVSFIESAPLVAKELGEQAVSELLSAAIKMYSKTSAEVLSLMFSTAPTAATRLGEIELFKGYLALLNNLVAKAPRAVRPFLESLDVLLGQLTLGGLRRWTAWGISAYRDDFEAQAEYFGLKSEQAKAVLKQEQRGVLFVDVQRRLIMYLRSLWARDFFLRPTSGDFETREGYRPYIQHFFIHLPDAFDDFAPEGIEPVPGLDVYRASAAHAAAHIVYSHYDLRADELSPLQKALIGVIEDARVEALAARDFPGLRLLWKKLLPVPSAHSRKDEEGRERLGPLLDRMARALLDPEYDDPHPLVSSARAAFEAAGERMDDPEMARDIGMELAGQVESMGLAFDPRADQYTTPYRDDNRVLWEAPEAADMEHGILPGESQQVRKYVSIMEMINEVEVETAGDDAQEIWVLKTELFPYEDHGVSYNEMEGKEPISSPYHYHEWDYQTQLERPNWVTLVEKRPKKEDPERIEEILERHKPLVRRLKFLIEAVQPQGVIRQRKVEDGDQIDLGPAIDAIIDIRRGVQPDPRIGIRTRLQVRDLTALLLIDLSESTNDPVPDLEEDGETTILDLAREAAALMADAMDKIGDPFAIHGFHSNGRHDVEYFRYKDFDMPYDDDAKGRLAGMSGELSTRMGAALRHAGYLLNQRPSQKKLLFLLTDGEPADNDVRDPQYLRFDTRKAVEELARSGVTTFCITLDPNADQYVSRIFGAKNYLILDHVSRLPEKLPELYFGLTK